MTTPYTLIEFKLQNIFAECIPHDVEYWHFTDNPRWIHHEGDDMSLGIKRDDNLQRVKCIGGNSYYDFKTKTWNNYTVTLDLYSSLPKIKNNIIEHSFEPINYSLDKEFWDIEYLFNRPYNYVDFKNYPVSVLHSEKNSNDIEILKHIGYKTIYWFSHAYLCSEHYFKQYFDLEIVTNYKARPIKNPWICANRLIDGPRKYRLEFLNLLDTEKGMYSLLDKDPGSNRSINQILHTNIVQPNSFDDHQNQSADITIGYLTDWNTSFLHIVNETVWQDKIHFTEKVFKPVVLHQPFVVLQAPGSLEYLRGYGFKTFGDWWDESYDSIEDPNERMQAIADIVNWIPSQDLYKMRTEMSGVLEHNFRHFYENIPDIVLDELRVNLKNAI